MAVITDKQVEIAGQLIIGQGTNYRFTKDWFDWWAAPEVRTSDQARSGADGYTPGRDLLGKHTMTLVCNILATTESQMGDRIDAWKAACASTPNTVVPVRANIFGRTRLRYGRFRKPGEVVVNMNSIIPSDGLIGLPCLAAMASAQFEALDPRTYGDTVNTASTTRTLPGSGFTPPFVPPFTLGASTGGVLTITNAGDIDAPWTARLTGPLDGITISHLESGNRLNLSLSANGGLTLGASDTLDFDSDARSVLLNGTGDRRTQLSSDSQWWSLQPGINTFQLDANSGTGTLTVSARDAFYS